MSVAGTVVGTIVEIRRYPVKSMQGELLDTVSLGTLGIEGDRLFAVRDVQTGKILSAKTPKVGSALLSCHARTVLNAMTNESTVVVTVNGIEFDADDRSIDPTLSALLDREVRLDRATQHDETYESYWPEIEGVALSDVTVDLPLSMSTAKGTFVDLAALHLLAVSSVEHLQTLNAELALRLDRFRPSIAIDATRGVHLQGSGFVEKNWVNKSAALGDATIAFGAESPRCIMTTLPQTGLPRQPAVLQTIAQHNRVEFGGFGNFACLGIYAEVTAGGRISIGDELRLTQ
jgi:uncharacterized protein